MPIIDTPAGTLEVTNAILSASEFRATQKISVSNSAPTKNFSVGDKFHVSTTDADAVNITGNLVAQKLKIGNLLVSPTFDLAAVSNVGNTTSNTLQFANATTSFVASSNVEIGGNITLTSNAQVKVGSNVLAEYTGPHGREPKEMPLKKFPEIAFDESKFDSNPTTNTYTQAGYTVSASNQYKDSYGSYRAFNHKAHASDLPGWATSTTTNLYSETTGQATSNATLFDGNRGEYIDLKLPHKIKVSHFTIRSRVAPPHSPNGQPGSGHLYGSDNGTDWVKLTSYSGLTYQGSSLGFETVTVNAAEYYNHLRLTATARVAGVSGSSWVDIGELEYYGYEEPAPPGDLSLDTTLKSTFNSVRSNNYVMYFDGKDPAAGNVPKNLVNDSSISITPHNAVFDATNNCWTLNGSTESNVTTGSLGFEGDVPHTVSTWINASNLEANALTQQIFSIGSGYDKAFLKVDDTQIAANTWHNVTYAYQGEGGSKVTYVDGRKVEEAQVEDTFGEYPPFAMTDYETGGYRVSASSEHSNTRTAWKAFDDLPLVTGSDITLSYWQSMIDTYETSGSYNWTGTGVQFTDTNGGQHSGEWIKLEMPHKLKLSYISYLCTYTAYMPKNFVILGSNDDNTWTLLKSVTGGTAVEDVYHDLAINADRSYKYYVWLTSAITGTGGEVLFANIKYYGHKEGDLTRFPEPTRVLKYPHIAFPNGNGETGNNQDETSHESYSKRGYVIKASGWIGSYPPYAAFNGEIGAGLGQMWVGGFNKYGDPPSNGSYKTNLTAANTRNLKADLGSGGSAIPNGEWLYIEMPNKLKVTSTRMISNPSDTQPPDNLVIYGTNDVSAGWNIVDNTYASSSSGIPNNLTGKTWNVSTSGSPVAYKYFAVVVTKLNVTGTTDGHVVLVDWSLFGTQEDTETPLIVGGPFAGKVANFRVYDQYLGDERIQEIYDAQKDEFGHKKSSMTFYKGRIGVGTTEPEGALTVIDEPHTLERFPATDLASNDTYIDGQGIIKVRSSYLGGYNRSLGVPDHALRTDVHAYRAFKGDRNWTSIPERNTRMSEEVDFGAWLKIQTPQSMSLKKAEIESKPDWRQVGSTINDSAEHAANSSSFGMALDCSDDGTRIIVGAYHADVSGTNRGQAFVFDWNGSDWVKLGNTLQGTQNDEHLGYAVAISGDGNYIAIGNPFYHTALLADAGRYGVFYLSGAIWTILPDSGALTSPTVGEIDYFVGTAASEQAGFSLSLSYDGKTISAGYRGSVSGAGGDAGQIRVHTYVNGAWTQKGQALSGLESGDRLGENVKITSDGNHLIAGASYGSVSAVYVYDYNSLSSQWVKRTTLTHPTLPNANTHFYGSGIAISDDGNTVAVGASGDDTGGTNYGRVYMYSWSGSAWTLVSTLTNPLQGTDNEYFGTAVDLSGDGTRLVAAAAYENNQQGYAFTYEYNGGSWQLRNYATIGSAGVGTNQGRLGEFYTGLIISRDGSTIVGGDRAGVGKARVFNMPSNIKSIWGSNDDVNWTKITTGNKTFRGNDRLEFKNLDNPNYYKYHAIVADAFTTLKNIRLYGIREKASSTIHDGALTLTKNLVVPRIGPAFDADDTPRRDRLVVEYTTSTNPTDYGYVKDTSGNGYDAKMVGVVYNPSDKSFECSASDGSQWIETQIPNGSRFNTQFTVSVWANMGQFNLTSLYGFIFALGDRNQTGLSSTSGNEISLVYNHAGLTEGTFFAGIEGANLIFKEWTTHDSHMGQWYHLTITYDGSTLYVYKNGENSGYAARTAPVLPDDNCVVRLFGDAVNENATHQGVQSRISNFKLYDCCLTRDEVRTLYDMGRCDEGHHVVSFEKTRVGIGLGDGCAPKADLDVRGRVRIGPSGQQWRTSGDDGDRLIEFHSGQATSGQPTLEVTHHGGTRVSPTPTVLQISNELGGGSDWSTTEPYALLAFANSDGSGSGVAGPAASVGAVCDTVSGGGDTRLAFFTNSGIDHLERMCVNHDGNVGIGTTTPHAKLQVNGASGSVSTTAGDITRYIYFINSGLNGGSGFVNNFGTVSIYASDDIVSSGSLVTTTRSVYASDERIKRDIVDVQDDEALQLLRLIEPKKYKYKDTFKNGDDEVYGFIAQQISNVFPDATQVRTSYIPNIYETANVASKTITFPTFNTADLESNTFTLRVMDGENNEHDITITEVIDEHSVLVEEDLTNLCGYVDENGDLVEQNRLFAWGQKVDDFIYLKKDSIWTVATTALQEVDRQLQAEKAKVTTLETQLTSVLARLDALENA